MSLNTCFVKYGLLPDIYTYSSVSSYYTPANFDEFTQKMEDLKTIIFVSGKTPGGGVYVIYELPHDFF